ncbi:NADH dehydrogenase subunit 1 (mitochondrion) [Choristoneura fumiferana]|uniref:NADH-ubiquinone oxidoreductase chain 1 n=2 Tax=Choristoneura fumiferana TaxID=7141 RepID=A0A343UWM7_CHOFU|nr:NADH dehydrogenase subunit 1 [Choristoneura fumiferana]AVI57936.1 NADH dehydrogenase subunit 1 [Choristoneura fumiferana]AYA73179.1 NADH dehydrogenase subunit 1 [Choristoneura fumiferana]
MFLNDYILILIGLLMLILGVLIGVAFLTLLERKVLGYIQIRKGPNKLGFTGILQPFSDAIKLFTKEQTYPLFSNYLVYYFSPIFSFFLSLLIWMVIPYYFNMISFNLGFLFFFCCTSLGVYTLMISGWSSNSNYSLLGGLRAVAQTISYEVSLALIMLSVIIMIMDFNLVKFNYYQSMIWFMFMMMPLSLCWLSSSLAETNRTPFDFAEGESELVSGFNIEYSSGGFALIFLAEYSSILFMSMLFILMYMGGYDLSLFFYLKLVFISFFFIWVRGTLPRYRYDKLMYLAWKSYLPLSLNFLMLFIGIKIFFI